MEQEVYQPRGEEREFDSRYITMLLRNYRSHPAIIKYPSDRFYLGKLTAHGEEEVVRSLERWEHLPSRGFPVLVKCVEGINEQEDSSPSWFNTTECVEVVQYVQLLISSIPDLRLPDIGIISPYSRQVKKIKDLLSMKTIPHGEQGVKVDASSTGPLFLILCCRSRPPSCSRASRGGSSSSPPSAATLSSSTLTLTSTLASSTPQSGSPAEVQRGGDAGAEPDDRRREPQVSVDGSDVEGLPRVLQRPPGRGLRPQWRRMSNPVEAAEGDRKVLVMEMIPGLREMNMKAINESSPRRVMMMKTRRRRRRRR
eukprot:141872-Hanusia_phi.AAC.1